MRDPVTHTVRHSEADEFADEHEDKQHPSASADQQPVTAHHWAMEKLAKPTVQHKYSELFTSTKKLILGQMLPYIAVI